VYDIFIFTGSESPVNYLWPAMHEVVDRVKRIVELRWKG
jgi:nitrogen-specific signal transduction histidine kinase